MSSTIFIVAVWYLLLPSSTTTMTTSILLRTSTTTRIQLKNSLTFSFDSNNLHHNQYDDRWNYRRRYRRRYQRRNRYLRAIPEDQEREVDQASYGNNINKQTDGTILLSDPTDENSSSSSSCPFSKTFPKFRIDLTTTMKNKKNRKKQQQQQQQWDFLPPIVVSSAAAVVEAANALELPTLSIPWKRSRQLNQLERKYVDDDLMFIVKSDIDGVTAFAFLWKVAARLMGLLHNNNDGDDDHASSNVAIIVLPDSSMELVQNFCEIANWQNRHTQVKTF